MEGGSKVGIAAAPSSGTVSDDVDERTIFVRSLPYTVADAQLEDYFSEVGPVRNSFTVIQKDPPPPSLAWHHKFQDPDDGRQRFLLELEFVQLLANPTYIHHLAQNRYFDDEAFVGYLKYLLYWKQPEYAKYIMYPHAFFFLDMLQSANFRAAMAHPANKEIAHRQQYYFWKHYRNNRLKQILPRPLPEVPAPPPPPPPPAPTPVVAAAPTKPEGSTRAGAGERRKRKHANS